MQIISKYDGVCGHCGGRIRPGDSIEWRRGTASRHSTCPTAKPTVAEITMYGQGAHKSAAHAVGTVLRSKTHGIVSVIAVSARYIAEDGMSFGLSDDRGWQFTYGCRPATDEEAAPLLATEQQREAVSRAKANLDAVKLHIQSKGARPEGLHTPEGNIIASTANLYGGGDWFVIGSDYIWYCRNNGADGDNWGANNVRTGGAGAIGWRVAYDDELADTVRTNLATLEGK